MLSSVPQWASCSQLCSPQLSLEALAPGATNKYPGVVIRAERLPQVPKPLTAPSAQVVHSSDLRHEAGEDTTGHTEKGRETQAACPSLSV